MKGKAIIVMTVLLVLSWGAYLIAGEKIAGELARRFGGALSRMAKGKIQDIEAFLLQIGWEGLLLLTLGSFLVMICAWFWKWTRGKKEEWIWKSAVCFGALNIWVGFALNTALFWGGMYTGERTSNYTQFQFKRILLQHTPAEENVILLGSSQTLAQIDESMINAALGKELWTTELHFPGSAGLDLLLVLRRLKEHPGELVVVYLSENYFYSGLHTEAAPFFARWQDIPLLRSIGLKKELWSEPFGYGFFGQALPLFRAREPLTHRVLGVAMAQTTQAAHDAALERVLAERAEKMAKRFAIGPGSEVQKKAFEEFIQEAGKQGRRVLLLEGQLNPLLSERLTSALREDMQLFLRKLAGTYKHVELIEEKQPPVQRAEDYDDLTHVNRRTQERFTEWLIEILREKKGGTEPQGLDATGRSRSRAGETKRL